MTALPTTAKRRRRCKAGHARGLTLLEMILSLTIVALIVALVSSGFNLAGTAIGGGERAAEQNQRIRLATDIMTRQIKSTVGPPYCAWDEEEDYEWPYFQGTRHDLAFVTAAAQSGGGGLAVVTYRVQGTPPQLLMAEATGVDRSILAQPERLAELPAQEALLLSGFSELHFEYLLSDGIENEWFEAWDGREEEELPTAVKVVIDGIAGLGGSLWTHQIPIMVAVTETQGECGDFGDDDDDGGGGDDDDDDDDTGGTGTPVGDDDGAG